MDGDEAELVAGRTRDACEHLMELHREDTSPALDTDFASPVEGAITYHAPCHLRAQKIGYRSRDLLELTGATIAVVAECSGIDGTWGFRRENFEASRVVAAKMVRQINRADNDVVAGDCHLANGAILEQTGSAPLHPLQVLARAYPVDE